MLTAVYSMHLIIKDKCVPLLFHFVVYACVNHHMVTFLQNF